MEGSNGRLRGAITVKLESLAKAGGGEQLQVWGGLSQLDWTDLWLMGAILGGE